MKIDNKIWTCWLQGEEDPSMPPLNRKCLDRLKELNPPGSVVILTSDNIEDYAPEYNEIICNSPRHGPAAKSDMLRLILLEKYGGTWIDASVYPMYSMQYIHDKITSDTGFFAYRMFDINLDNYPPRSPKELETRLRTGFYERLTSSWFLYAPFPDNYLISKWKELFQHKFQTATSWPYFTVHRCLTQLYKTDDKVKEIIENMIQIDYKEAGSAGVDGWSKRVESYMYKRPDFNR